MAKNNYIVYTHEKHNKSKQGFVSMKGRTKEAVRQNLMGRGYWRKRFTIEKIKEV